ncbi:histidinol-phosphate aminotransferase [Ammonifex degensii KC4]|uniref:Histidinol-phosphate aminotransferase n=1 Tax=Ammonifex degensii (strain DSM 10501 / KC4) TaxID=429009 RepID=C9RDE5_AMMDK|nr:histidinol-phosphate transaminase [Ammonifex degensii]ACX52272.1 histidinol-phosphate aminotransferase [Ammonifex degensii KC4]
MAVKVRPELSQVEIYRPGKPIEEVKKELGLEEVVKLASNENPLGPSPKAVAALEGLDHWHLYPEGSSYELRQALGKKLEIDPDSIIVGCGSSEVIQMLSLALLAPGDEVVIPVPTFPRYEPLARLMGANPVKVPLKDYRIDVEAVARALSPRTKLVYLCNPNNPTGTIVTREEVEWFLEKAGEGVLTVLDEAYCEYVTSPAYPDGLDFLRRGYNVVVLRTFSKIYGLAGLRIGYGVADRELVAELHRVREPFNVSSAAQIAALAALEDEEFVALSRQVNEEGKVFLYRELERRGIAYVPTEANFLLFDAGRDEQEVFRRMLRQGVIIRGGVGYPTHLRVTIGTLEQNQRFLEALDKALELRGV